MGTLNPFDCPLLGVDHLLPLHVVDVGAEGGIDGVWARWCADGLCRAYGFEPFPENFRKLRGGTNVTYFQQAISDRTGEAELMAYGGLSFLSQTRPDAPANAKFEPVRVKTEMLANLRRQGVIPRIDVLKIDVEGHEEAVLRGGEDFLCEPLYVKAEFSFDRSKSNRFTAIDETLTGFGMRLFEFATNYNSFQSLRGGDVLYLRDVAWIVNGDADTDVKKAQLLRLILVSLINGYYKYAYVCARAGADRAVYTRAEARALTDFLTAAVYLPDLLGRFPGRHAVTWLLFTLSQLFAGSGAGKSLPKDNRLQKSTRLWTSNALLNGWLKGRVAASWNQVYEDAKSYEQEGWLRPERRTPARS